MSDPSHPPAGGPAAPIPGAAPAVGPAGRLPSRAGLAVICAAAVLAGGTLLAGEAFWRLRGVTPSANDSVELWAWHRDRAAGGTPRGVVFAGASRCQLGIDLATARDVLGDRSVVQLAIAGTPPERVLEDLSADPRVTGTIVCGITAWELRPERFDAATPYVRARGRLGQLDAAAARLGCRFTRRFCVLREELGLVPLALTIGGEFRLPDPAQVSQITTFCDRGKAADYLTSANPAALEELRRWRVARHRGEGPLAPMDPALFETQAARLRPWVGAIGARGGRVVLVRFPTTGEHWEIDQLRTPKAAYWDRLAGLTGADTLHFADVPALAAFDCPDTSHLDVRDTPAFTAALLDALARRGWL